VVVLEESIDSWGWKWNNNGAFTVKTMYNHLHQCSRPISFVAVVFPMRLVWKVKIPMNIKLFFWSLILDKIPSKELLRIRGFDLYVVCSMCGHLEERLFHLFLHCSLALKVWKCLTTSRREGFEIILRSHTVKEALNDWPKRTNHNLGGRAWELLPYAIMWILWITRNELIFRDKTFTIRGICAKMKGVIYYWLGNWRGRQNYHFNNFIHNWDDLVKV
ncbi:hypothetical protein FRX31_027250, partial [Thalictrum thalictroides]